MRAFIRHQRGAALIEFALVLPILAVIVFGSIEMGRLLLIQQKMDKIAASLSDAMAQSRSVELSTINAISGAIPDMAAPLSMKGASFSMTAVAFGVSAPAPCSNRNFPCVVWKQSRGPQAVSRTAGVGGSEGFRGLIAPRSGQAYIISEVFYNYSPLFSSFGGLLTWLQPRELYAVSVYKLLPGTDLQLR